jgi:hypothetical protein
MRHEVRHVKLHVSQRPPSKTNAHQGGRPVPAIHTTAKHLRPLRQEARDASHDAFDRGRREGRRDAGLSGVMTCVLLTRAFKTKVWELSVIDSHA